MRLSTAGGVPGNRRSHQAGFAEAVVAAAERIGAGAAEDDVIDQGDLDGLGGLAQQVGDLHIRGAGRGIAAYTKFPPLGYERDSLHQLLA